MLESEKNFSKYQIRPGAKPAVAPRKITPVAGATPGRSGAARGTGLYQEQLKSIF